MKNRKQASNLNQNQKTNSLYVLHLNFSIKQTVKTLFLISHFSLSKRKENEKELAL